MGDNIMTERQDTVRETKKQQSGRFLYKISDVAYKELSISSYVTAPVSVWISGVLLGLSCILYVTAFVTTGWGVVTEAISGNVVEVGLWHSCVQSSGACQKIYTQTGTYRLCQSLACFALIGLLLSVLVLTLCCVSRHMRKKPLIQLSTFLLRPVSAIFLLLTFAIYGGTWNKPNYTEPTYITSLSYSHSLTIASFTFELLASFLMGLEWQKWRELNNGEAPNQLNECVDHVLRSGGNSFEEVPEETTVSSNITTPYELYKMFSEGGNNPHSNERMAVRQHNESSKNNYKAHSDTNRKKMNRQYSDGGNKLHPSEGNSNDVYEELNGIERQAPHSSSYYYNDGYIPDDSRNNRNSLTPNQPKSNRHSHYSDNTSPKVTDNQYNVRSNVQPTPYMDEGSAIVEVHHIPTQPQVKPKMSRKSGKPGVPTSEPFHSYENIPDGQPSAQRSRHPMNTETNDNQNHTRRDYSHSNKILSERKEQPHYYNQTHTRQRDVTDMNPRPKNMRIPDGQSSTQSSGYGYNTNTNHSKKPTRRDHSQQNETLSERKENRKQPQYYNQMQHSQRDINDMTPRSKQTSYAEINTSRQITNGSSV